MERDQIVQLVASNIEAVMKVRGTNASALAREASVNPTGIYDILSGKSRSPRLDTIHKIARALRVPVAYLFEDRVEGDVRSQIIEVFVQLSAEERVRLLQAAKSWLPQAD